MKTVYISYQSIKYLRPCSDQLRNVCKLFGKRKRLAVTVKRAVALSSQFDFHWLAQRTLTASALQAYHAATAPSLRAYIAVRESALQAYNAATAPAPQAYEVARASAWAQQYIKQQTAKG